MSQNATSLTRQQVLTSLSQIIGLPLTASRRATDLRTFQFGTLRAVERGSVGDFALHVQCPWRIEGPDGIVTGRMDLWEPAEEDGPFDEDWDYEKSPNLQDARLERWLAEHEGALFVKSIDADEFGGASISLDQDFVLRIFPAGTRGENWRLFRPKAVYRIWSSVEARRTEADIPGFQLRDLRYTCATRLADIGEELVTVAEILGHTDIRMTRRYSHDMQERKREALERTSPSRDVNLTPKRRNYKNGRVRTLP